MTDFSKLRATFKLPRFTGQALAFKPFVKALDRYASIQGLDEVMVTGYPSSVSFCFEVNKLFYYVLQEALPDASKATIFFNTAAKWDGHGAYLSFYNGYTFIGSTTATILLGQLASLRLETDETITDFVLRLQALFEDLENIPGDAHYAFNDVQRIGYLLQTIRHEPDLAVQHTFIQSAVTRNAITFDSACDDLIVRDDALRADLLMNASGRPRKALMSETKDKAKSSGDKKKPTAGDKKKALISTAAKKLVEKSVSFADCTTTCLVKDCEKIRSRGMCRLHFMELTSGKVSSHPLTNDWGTATYSTTDGVQLPDVVPDDRRMTASYLPRATSA